MTDADARLDYKNIKGSRADDTITPITALFSVRGQLSRRAVTRAIETVHALEFADPLVKDRPLVGENRGDIGQRSQTVSDQRILFVDVEQQTLALSFGWKISKVTNDIVRLMMGRPELCPPEKRLFPVKPEIETIVQAVEQNSCVKRRIIGLLEAK